MLSRAFYTRNAADSKNKMAPFLTKRKRPRMLRANPARESPARGDNPHCPGPKTNSAQQPAWRRATAEKPFLASLPGQGPHAPRAPARIARESHAARGEHLSSQVFSSGRKVGTDTWYCSIHGISHLCTPQQQRRTFESVAYSKNKNTPTRTRTRAQISRANHPRAYGIQN